MRDPSPTGLRKSAAALIATCVACLLVTTPATARPRHYSMSDFARVQKVDAHMHIYGPANLLVAAAIRDGFHLLTINVDDPDHGSVPRQLRDAASLRRRYPGRVAFAGTFSAAGFTQPGWSRAALHAIDTAMAQGAVGVKIWKNFGMIVRDRRGRYVMPDDPRLEPIYSMLQREHIVLLGHLAEPLDCWLPYAKMTVKGDADYYRQHPEYYMYLHPDRPGHDEILAARDRMLAAHPQLRFDAVHLASLEWDVDRIGPFSIGSPRRMSIWLPASLISSIRRKPIPTKSGSSSSATRIGFSMEPMMPTDLRTTAKRQPTSRPTGAGTGGSW